MADNYINKRHHSINYNEYNIFNYGLIYWLVTTIIAIIIINYSLHNICPYIYRLDIEWLNNSLYRAYQIFSAVIAISVVWYYQYKISNNSYFEKYSLVNYVFSAIFCIGSFGVVLLAIVVLTVVLVVLMYIILGIMFFTLLAAIISSFG